MTRVLLMSILDAVAAKVVIGAFEALVADSADFLND
jgi:hypothetical protein